MVENINTATLLSTKLLSIHSNVSKQLQQQQQVMVIVEQKSKQIKINNHEILKEIYVSCPSLINAGG